MLRTLTIELPETTFELIEEQAQNQGLQPSELVVELLAAAVQRIQNIEPDPLDSLVGALDVPLHDLADQHDSYLGEALLKEMHHDPRIH